MGWFTLVFVRPLYNLLVWLLDVVPFHDLGLAIITTTLLVRLLLLYFTYKSLSAQKTLQDVQPKIAEIREKYKDDKEELARQLMATYKENNVNPLASCLPLLVQLPIFIALFRLLRTGFETINTEMLYPFVANPGVVQQSFLGLIDLSSPSIYLAIPTAIAQYLQVKQTMRKPVAKEVAGAPGTMDETITTSMNRTMLWFLPGFTLIVGATSLPGGVMLYWFTTTIFTVALYALFLHKKRA